MKISLLNNQWVIGTRDFFQKAFYKIPWILGRSAFFVIIVAMVVEIVIGQLLFYRYAFLTQRASFEITEQLSFDEVMYQSVLASMAKRTAALEDFSTRSYQSPFQ